MMTLTEFLERQTARHGGLPALQYRPRYRTIGWTYTQLAERTALLADALTGAGIRPGDRVLLHSHNSPGWVAAFFAVVQCGGVVVPLNPRSPLEQVQRIVESARPRLLLRSRRSLAPGPVALPAWDIEADAGGFPSRLAAADKTDDEPPPAVVEILYTSGTTGDPKGVMLTHANLLFDMEALSERVPLQSQDRVINLAPLFHAYGQMTGMLCPLLGGCAVRHVGPPTTRAIQEALQYFPATHLILVPEILKALIQRVEQGMGRIPGGLSRLLRGRIRRRISPTLHTLICGGAPLEPELEEKCRDLGFEVLQGYGLTETSPAVAANAPGAHRLGSVGRPLAGLELKLAADGEVLVRGPMVMAGYYRRPELTADAFEGEWLRTGDIGRLDEDGYLYLQGRRRYRIITESGENVFPEDIEAELNRVDGVLDSAVIGRVEAGRTLIHAVLLCSPPQAQAAVAEANRRLAPHQHIVSWSVWPEPDFPRSVTRKVRKELVLRSLSERPHQGPESVGLTTATPLKRLLAEVTGVPVNGILDELPVLAGLGIDSMLRIELVARLEERLGVCLEEASITPELTVAGLEILARNTAGIPLAGERPACWSRSAWAVRLRPLAVAVLLQSWIPIVCRLRVEGLEQLRDWSEPRIFMANHRSYLDSVALALALPPALRNRLCIAAATSVLYRRYAWAVPLAELTLNAFPLPTEFDENIQSGFNAIGHRLDEGGSVLLFPEGQMNRGAQPLLPLKGGTGVIAVEMQTPVVPVAIRGAERVLPPGVLLPRERGIVTVRFGKPLSFGSDAAYSDATNTIQKAIEELLQELSC